MRWGGVLPKRKGALAVFTGVVCLIVVASVLAAINRSPAAIAATADHVSVVTMTVPTTTVPANSSVVDVPGASSGEISSPVASVSPVSTSEPAWSVPRILVVGDSTGQSNGAGMQKWAGATGAAEVDVFAEYSCAFLVGQKERLREGWEVPVHASCPHLFDDAVTAAERLRPDAIVLFLGSDDLVDWQLSGETQWRAIGDPIFDAEYVAAANDALSRLESTGVPVLMADVPVPNWDPDAQFGAGNVPGSGPATMNSIERTDRLNQLDTAIVAAHPAVRLIPYAEGLERPDRSVDPAVRPDGLHLAVDAVVDVMNRWFLDDLVAGYRAVAAAAPSTVQRPTTWAAP